jgi:hypothetical protein
MTFALLWDAQGYLPESWDEHHSASTEQEMKALVAKLANREIGVAQFVNMSANCGWWINKPLMAHIKANYKGNKGNGNLGPYP